MIGRQTLAAVIAASLLLVGCATGEVGNQPDGETVPAIGPAPAAPAVPSATPTQTDAPAVALPTASPTLSEPDGEVSDSPASRLVIESLDVDLPVVSGDLDVPGNSAGWPLCDVAQYLEAYRQPGQAGTTYLYAHAQRGMLLPLLEASEREEGRELIGLPVSVYTADGNLHRYEIFAVRRHATDYRLADSVRPGARRLLIQTSEGPAGTEPKLQVAAEYLGSRPAAPEDATPAASPRVCG